MKKTITLLAIISAALFNASCTPPEYGEMNPSVATPKLSGNYPSAFLTNKKGKVISPFKPYNIMDVSGMQPGHLAQDPTTAAIDPKTNKPIKGTAKTFRIPQPAAPKPAQETQN